MSEAYLLIRFPTRDEAQSAWAAALDRSPRFTGVILTENLGRLIDELTEWSDDHPGEPR